MRKFLSASVLMASVMFSPMVQAQTIAIAKAAELSIHRIERLITLKRIDENFMKRLYSIAIAQLPAGQPTDPAFKATVSQIAGPDGKAHQVDILMDGAGKALSQVVRNGTDPTSIPAWPDKDPITLSENSLHFVLEAWKPAPGGAGHAEILPFFDGMTSMVLDQVSVAGKTFARVVVRSSLTPSVLEILTNVDGTFASYKIL